MPNVFSKLNFVRLGACAFPVFYEAGPFSNGPPFVAGMYQKLKGQKTISKMEVKQDDQETQMEEQEKQAKLKQKKAQKLGKAYCEKKNLQLEKFLCEAVQDDDELKEMVKTVVNQQKILSVCSKNRKGKGPVFSKKGKGQPSNQDYVYDAYSRSTEEDLIPLFQGEKFLQQMEEKQDDQETQMEEQEKQKSYRKKKRHGNKRNDEARNISVAVLLANALQMRNKKEREIWPPSLENVDEILKKWNEKDEPEILEHLKVENVKGAIDMLQAVLLANVLQIGNKKDWNQDDVKEILEFLGAKDVKKAITMLQKRSRIEGMLSEEMLRNQKLNKHKMPLSEGKLKELKVQLEALLSESSGNLKQHFERLCPMCRREDSKPSQLKYRYLQSDCRWFKSLKYAQSALEDLKGALSPGQITKTNWSELLGRINFVLRPEIGGFKSLLIGRFKSLLIELGVNSIN